MVTSLNDFVKFSQSIKESIDKNSWGPILKSVSEIGIEKIISYGVGLMSPMTPVSILGAVALSVTASWLGNEYLIPYIDNIIDEIFE